MLARGNTRISRNIFMIVVTGGAGFIGSHFINCYLKHLPDGQVTVVDNLCEGHREALELFSGHVTLVEADISDLAAMRSLFARLSPSAVIHFAGSCYVGESQQNPLKYFRNNVIASLNLFQAMEEAGTRKIIFSSSCAVYGIPPTLPILEDFPRKPVNVYGLTKHMIEEALEAYAARLNWSYVALRYFNAAGADPGGMIGETHNPETHIIPLALMTAAGRKDVLDINGDDYDTPDGTCIRDYIHVNDLAEAHVLALSHLESGAVSDAINLGTDRGASVREIIDLCQQVTGREIRCRIMPRRNGDPPVLVASSEKAKRVLGWQPRFTLKEAVETAWRWQQNRRY